MRFSIVTPSFRHSQWLKLCIASVADQQVDHEHIIQDSLSDDGTQDWLPHDRRVTAVIEKDNGMYDAVNRGFRRARGELLAYLNCDEQYLPGTLRKVSTFFEQHPGVDVLFGDCVVVDERGRYICDRTAMVPQRLHTAVCGNLSFLTAAMFIRGRTVEQRQLYFDPALRAAGDAEWTLRLIQSGARMAVLREFLSVFTETGGNLSLSAGATHEADAVRQRAPAWARMLAPLGVAHFRLRRLFAGGYFGRPYEYAIYTPESPDKRQVFRVTHPTHRWRR